MTVDTNRTVYYGGGGDSNKRLNMKMTRILPTDKNGNVYYGPKTLAQGQAAVRDMGAEPARVVSDMRRAGYTGAAARLAKQYDQKANHETH